MSPPPIATPTEALRAVSRLLAAGLESAGTASVQQTLVREARVLFSASGVVLLDVDARERVATVVAADPELPGHKLGLDAAAPLAALVTLRRGHARAAGPEAEQLGRVLRLERTPGVALALALRSREAISHVLVVLGEPGRAFPDAEVDAGAAFAAAAAASLAQVRLQQEEAARGARQAALARAAKKLTQHLELPAVLSAICREACGILHGDVATVYRGDPDAGLVIEASSDPTGRMLGFRLAPGQGLSGRVAQAGRPLLTNDYQRISPRGAPAPFADLRSCLAVPMAWDGRLGGVLAVGFRRPHHVGAADLALLEAFAEIAAAACRNASEATILAHAARTDALTGCLNHAALQDGLRREVERAARTGRPLGVVLLDLDGFKLVNDLEGHLVGDEVLRRVGHALRVSTRPYDLVARYGGDEFCVVAVDADEATTAEVARRAVDRIVLALRDVGGDGVATGATAGVVAWRPGNDADDLLGEADRALLHGKHAGRRGEVLLASAIPVDFVAEIGDSRRSAVPERTWVPQADAERLQRRTRQLTMANALGARLAAMTDVQQICEATVEELHRAFDFFLCAVVRVRDDGAVEHAATRGVAFQRLDERRWSQAAEAGVIGRALRERAVVLVEDVDHEPAYEPTPETIDVRSELVVPLWVGDRLWGALDVQELATGALDDDDAQLLQTVADQVGSALRGALLYERLERAYLGTAEALAAALEAKDAYTAQHAESIVQWAEAVGARLGMAEAELRDLRYGAVFHDIGKIAVPEAVLNKQGPLTEDEWSVVQRHTVVGEQILAPVEFLAGVRPLVRHEHERYDGGGYPDGLRGDDIPLGARIILVCDAYHAMTSDRPYRSAMRDSAAREELRAHAGTQFDPRVVEHFLAVLDEEALAGALAPPARRRHAA